MSVLDASALLAFLRDEPGRKPVGEQLAVGPCFVSAANWSEVWQKALQHKLSTNSLAALAALITIEPVTAALAQRAAEVGLDAPALSLADRMCLALAAERNDTAWTADGEWAQATNIRVQLIR